MRTPQLGWRPTAISQPRPVQAASSEQPSGAGFSMCPPSRSLVRIARISPLARPGEPWVLRSAANRAAVEIGVFGNRLVRLTATTGRMETADPFLVLVRRSIQVIHPGSLVV